MYSWGNRKYGLYLARYWVDGHAEFEILPENWLTIAGAWPLGNEPKLKERMAILKGKGIAAKTIKTDDYPKLTPGLSAIVVAGPTNKWLALVALKSLKGVVPDAFIKQGD